MAFKILNEEEIALLTDKQRINYEKELDMYQQRVRFVERMEELEKVEIEPYEPVLKPIVVIDGYEAKPFKKTEVKVVLQNSVAKPELDINPINKVEKEQVKLPKVSEAKAVVPTIKTVDKQKLSMPTVETPVMSKNVKMKENLKHTPENIPTVEVSDIKIKQIKFEKEEKVNLPQMPECVMPEVKFEKPIEDSIDLPRVETPSVKVGFSGKIENAKPNVPEVAVVSELPQITMQKPEQQVLDMPVVTVPKNTVDYQGVKDIQKPQLASIDTIEIKENKFVRPEINKVELVLEKIEIKECSELLNTKLDFSNLSKFNENNVKLKSVDEEKMNIEIPLFSAKKIKAMGNIGVNVDGMPKIMQAKVPNANDVLKELLPAANR